MERSIHCEMTRERIYEASMEAKFGSGAKEARQPKCQRSHSVCLAKEFQNHLVLQLCLSVWCRREILYAFVHLGA